MDLDNNQIFISIAAYRDPQLVPTIRDCIAKARNPVRLRFGICRQHGPDDPQLPYRDGARFQILDVPWRDSKGACWARAEIMNLWRGEPWYLQVDSHCRFSGGWDDALIQMMHQSAASKPILSTYATPFVPGPNEVLAGAPLQIAFQGFTAEGIPHMKPMAIPNWQTLNRPLRARFLSAGFLFTSGNFVREVPYDPDLYFLGEEASMTLRGFTHGYDLFHPCETIVWHDYVRKDGIKHWEDHTEANNTGAAWNTRDLASRNKIQKLLSGRPIEGFGVGTARTIQEFEEYAGLSFKLRRAQDYTIRAEEPPNPKVDSGWSQEIYSWLVRLHIPHVELPQIAWNDLALWYIGVQDEYKNEIFRRDLSSEELKSLSREPPETVLVCEFQSGTIPATWVIWPVSRTLGWLNKIEGKFADQDFTIVLDEE